MTRSIKAVVMSAVMAGVAYGQADLSRDERTLADVAGERIQVADVQAEVTAERRKDVAAGRLNAFGSGAVQRALQQLVETKRLVAAARAEKLDQRADIRRELQRAADQVLASAMTAHMSARTPLAESDLRAYYERHRGEFQAPARVKARHIVVKTEAEALAVLGKLKRNADFAQLAREHNIDATRQSGGELGWVTANVMVPQFDAALFALRVGEISGVISTPYGFHIAQVQEIETPTAKPFDRVAAQVRQKVVEAALAEQKAELAKRYPVTIRTDVLKTLP